MMPIYRNWKDPQEYEFTKDLSNKGWAWEFLRRNQEYQADWEYELELYFQRKQKQYPESSETLSPEHPMFSINPKHSGYLFKWGIFCLINPEQDAPGPGILDFEKEWGGFYTGYGGHCLSQDPADLKKVHLCDGQVAYLFDMSLPLKPQINKAYKDLQSKQKHLTRKGDVTIKRPKLHKEDWPGYLRVLDAKAAGVNSNDEIASILLPGKDNVHPDYQARNEIRKDYEAAQYLIKGGYKLIIAT